MVEIGARELAKKARHENFGRQFGIDFPEVSAF